MHLWLVLRLTLTVSDGHGVKQLEPSGCASLQRQIECHCGVLSWPFSADKRCSPLWLWGQSSKLKNCACTSTGMLGNIRQGDRSYSPQRSTDCYKSRVSHE